MILHQFIVRQWINEFVFDLSNPNIVEDMEKFSEKFDILRMITNGYNSQWPSLSDENRYHLSTEDKQIINDIKVDIDYNSIIQENFE